MAIVARTTSDAELSGKQTVTENLIEVAGDLEDNDVFPIYDSVALSNNKSFISRIWTYISDKISNSINTFVANQIFNPSTVLIGSSSDNQTGAKLQVTGITTLGDNQDHAKFGSDGTLRLVGEATVWDDLMIPGFSVKTSGSSPPDLLVGFAGNPGLDIYTFDGVSTLEQVYFTLQLPHCWKEGSNIEPHVHFCPTSTNSGDTTPRVVRFKLEYTWANIDEVFGTSETVNMDSNPFIPNTSRWKHLICHPSASINGSGKTFSSMLICRLYRQPTDAVDTYPQDAAFLQFDIHYEIDSLGSTLEYTK